jgi:hypothetical protein
MKYQNQYIYIECRPNEPEIFFRDKTDVYNETSGYTTKKRGVNRFIKFLEQVFQDERLKDDIQFKDITKLLQNANVQYRTYCAMD